MCNRLTPLDKGFLAKLFPYVRFRPEGIIVKVRRRNGVQYNAVLPSEQFPVPKYKPLEVFCCTNTVGDITNQKLLQVFNNIKFKVEDCCSNVEQLLDNCKKAGVKGIDMYAGWIVNRSHTIQHVWAVYDMGDGRQSILDGSLSKNLFRYMSRYNGNKELINKRLRAEVSIPNVERFINGNVGMDIVYIGAKTTSVEARQIRDKLAQTGNDQYLRPAV